MSDRRPELTPEQRRRLQERLRREAESILPSLGCRRCCGGWVCDEHPDQPAGHAGCEADTRPCLHEGWSADIGLECRRCQQLVVVVSEETETATVFFCLACAHEWRSDEPPEDGAALVRSRRGK